MATQKGRQADILNLINDNAGSLGLHLNFSCRRPEQSPGMCSCKAKEVSGERMGRVLAWSSDAGEGEDEGGQVQARHQSHPKSP